MDLRGIEAAMYLRKSRPEDGLDTDAILQKHRDTLTELAEREGVRIVGVYREVRSGESGRRVLRSLALFRLTVSLLSLEGRSLRACSSQASGFPSKPFPQFGQFSGVSRSIQWHPQTGHFHSFTPVQSVTPFQIAAAF